MGWGLIKSFREGKMVGFLCLRRGIVGWDCGEEEEEEEEEEGRKVRHNESDMIDEWWDGKD